jgi:hypothetical protein
MTFLKIIWFPIANVRQTSNAKLIIAPRPSLVGISYDHASIKLDDFHWNLFISGQGSTIVLRVWRAYRKKIPSSRIWTSDLWITAFNAATTVHRSTNWAIEGYEHLTTSKWRFANIASLFLNTKWGQPSCINFLVVAKQLRVHRRIFQVKHLRNRCVKTNNRTKQQTKRKLCLFRNFLFIPIFVPKQETESRKKAPLKVSVALRKSN